MGFGLLECTAKEEVYKSQASASGIPFSSNQVILSLTHSLLLHEKLSFSDIDPTG